MDWTTRARFEDKNFGERVAGLDVFCSMEDVYGYVSYSITFMIPIKTRSFLQVVIAALPFILSFPAFILS